MGERLIVKTIRGLEQAHKCLCSRVPPESTATHTCPDLPAQGGRERRLVQGKDKINI